MLYAETLSNPTLRMVDLPRLVEVAHVKVHADVCSTSHSQLSLLPAACGCRRPDSCQIRIQMQGLTCVVDNTFASLTVSPAVWGVDVVVQSLTKYTSGSGDIVAGVEAALNCLLHTQPLARRWAAGW